jgi:hypothetical protein
MHGAIDVSADVQRHVDALGDNALRLQVLGVIHLVAGVPDPTRRVDIHEMGQICNPHRSLLCTARRLSALVRYVYMF